MRQIYTYGKTTRTTAKLPKETGQRVHKGKASDRSHQEASFGPVDGPENSFSLIHYTGRGLKVASNSS